MSKTTHTKAADANDSAAKNHRGATGQNDKGDDTAPQSQPPKTSTQSDAAQRQSNDAHGKNAAKTGKKA